MPAAPWLPVAPADPLLAALERFLVMAEDSVRPARYESHTLKRWTANAGPQSTFFDCGADEALFGGAAGGGKSAAEIALPLRWCNHPAFRALILRRETTQLQDLLDKAADLYPKEYTKCEWRGAPEHTWTFPSGAVIRFGHCKDADDWEKYAGHEYHLIEFDELTHFLLKQYREITKRIRSAVPELPRFARAATNPGSVGHAWVFKRWAPWIDPDCTLPDWTATVLDAHGHPYEVSGKGLPSRVENGAWDVDGSQGDVYTVACVSGEWTCTCADFRYRGHDRPCKHVAERKARVPRQPPASSGQVLWVVQTTQGERFSSEPVEGFPTRTFIPAKLTDNPKLTDADPLYAQKLLDNDPVRVAQLRDGNWLVKPAAGIFFKREWFEVVDTCPLDGTCARVWDLAATEPSNDDPDPDWTVGLLGSKSLDGFFYIEHVERFRVGPGEVRAKVRAVAEEDGREVPVRLPQDPGQAGKDQASGYVQLLEGWDVRTKTVSGAKETRWSIASAQASPHSTGGLKGRIRVVKGEWNDAFFEELEALPTGAHDDQADTLADLIAELTAGGPGSVGVELIG